MGDWRDHLNGNERMLLEDLVERKAVIRAERRKLYDRARKRMERANTDHKP